MYDPSTGLWSNTGPLTTARQQYTSTLLPGGKILVAGGVYCELFPGCVLFHSAELYDTATGAWSPSGSTMIGRSHHTATTLLNGKVLVAGDGVRLHRAELFDPANGTWSFTGGLSTSRFDHTATLLPNGKVLVVGGAYCTVDPDSGNQLACFFLNTAELYDPTTGTWRSTGNLNVAHAFHTATLLPDGKVLVTGGFSNSFTAIGDAELYDPVAETWSSTDNLNIARASHSATLLGNGQVLVAGGTSGDPLSTAELYDPATGAWSATASLNRARGVHTATLLPNGKVLVAGGSGDNTTELYDPGASSVSNQIDDADFFVRQHYRDFLNREPDQAGLDYWKSEITSCGNDNNCIEVKRINVSAAFFLSIEFQETGYLAYRMYKTAFGDTTSLGVSGMVPIIRRHEFLPDSLRISQGVQVGIDDWRGQLEANKNAYALEFVSRQRFLDAYPLSLTPSEFVDGLNTKAGGVLSSFERDQLVAELSADPTVAGRASAILRVAEDEDLRRAEFIRSFVLMQYYGYLRRNPDDPQDTNFDGWKFWLDKLAEFESNFLRAEMVKAFLSSTEYRKRFGP